MVGAVQLHGCFLWRDGTRHGHFSAILVHSVSRLDIKNADSVNSFIVADAQTTTIYHIIH